MGQGVAPKGRSPCRQCEVPWRRNPGWERSLPGLGTVKIDTSSLSFQDPEKTLGAVPKTAREPPIQTVYKRWGRRGLQLAGTWVPRDLFRHWLPVLGQQAKPRLLSFPRPGVEAGLCCLLAASLAQSLWSGSCLGSLGAPTPSVQAALRAP